ncbi:MAG: hypothetical protein JXA41_02775 [Deltaproteobacteria bacterium]|nr:hypothetical protein [Deltaproteobacteria bacterium]
MKKMFIVALAAMLCVFIAMPAAAEVQIHGMIWVDAYMRDINADATTVNTNSYSSAIPSIPGKATLDPTHSYYGGWSSKTYGDVKDTQVTMPYSQNYLNFVYFNKAGNLGANFTICGGSVNDFANWNQMNTGANIWFKPSKALHIRLGKIDQFIGGLYPGVSLANAEYYRMLSDPADSDAFDSYMHAGPNTMQVPASITFGNLHSTSKLGIDFAYTLSKAMTLKVALFDPDVDGTAGNYLNTTGTTAAGKRGVIEDSTLPRVDVAVPMRFGPVYAQPKVSWVRQSLQNMTAGSEDEFDVWLAGVDASVTFGPITLAGEYVYAENIGGSNHTGGLSTQGPRAYLDGTVYKIATEENSLWWVELGWAISPKLVAKASYGVHNMECDNSPSTVLDDVEFERSHIGVSVRYALHPNCFIQPQWLRQDFGEAKLGVGQSLGILKVDMGQVDYYGVSVYLMF